MARVAVVGPGAIGSVSAAAVQRAGHELVLCGRRDPGKIRVEELWSSESVTLGSRVLTSAGQVDSPADWVLVAVKAHQTDGAAPYLRALCGPDTAVVVLQNGVEHRERVRPHLDGQPVLPAIVWMEAETVAPGHTLVRRASRLKVPAGELGQRFAGLVTGIDVSLEADFATELWRKLTSNAVAGLMALAGRRTAIFAMPDIRELADALALECLTVARAEGARLDDTAAAEIVDGLAGLPPGSGSSILFDRLADRPLEWEARNGVVRRKGREHGLPTPISDVIVPLLAAASNED
ncbi:2-dehydropantoate 2-reductase [Nonomuraea sp. NBC_01738]|uniref:2-dehydropantoate 2-reductase n=1 Tax=Nonomuraea sp. NBC_01738 TaxID=2976003 RepID=UPI002E0EBCC4|nr:2-dehydropantoate 2-reductase [Nonomuraea sp. NBC_01738]